MVVLKLRRPYRRHPHGESRADVFRLRRFRPGGIVPLPERDRGRFRSACRRTVRRRWDDPIRQGVRIRSPHCDDGNQEEGQKSRNERLSGDVESHDGMDVSWQM
ncbi:hypothetical protein A5CPEGH6_12320 [Alistipes dispar]|uniref:Uncharacterized protein n=1 Tax=Alistipes dispar TaxID=2585119 RepID=A0A4Y1X1I0_9BACT|nr:hypothetical protein A5CPEGH6_12320 [Alistipes dispar]